MSPTAQSKAHCAAVLKRTLPTETSSEAPNVSGAAKMPPSVATSHVKLAAMS